MSGYLIGLENDFSMDWRSRTRVALYRRDPQAYLYDTLGTRWHSIQQDIGEAWLANDRTLVKSGNGSGKSRQVAELVFWTIGVHEPGEKLCIVSAPTLRQVEQVIFAYLKGNYSKAKRNGFPPPGDIADSLMWTFRETPRSAKRTLVIGMKPSDSDVVSTFQGIRAVDDEGGDTYVFIDEAGGVPSDLFTAAEAVTTGSGNKIMGIGNPDRNGTEFHTIFQKPIDKETGLRGGWSTHTISVLDLPTITGEIVYPGEPEKQKAMLESGMNDQKWVDQAKLAWGEDSARYMSKVLGEFPDADDRSFFSQSAIDKADDTTILEDLQLPFRGGLDLARFGEDDSMLYGNRGGRIRKIQAWSKATANESATRAHQHALDNNIEVLVVDAAGLGGPIVDQLAARAEGRYDVIAALGAERSPDPTRWANARAYWYDMLRERMLKGEIDLHLTPGEGDEDGQEADEQLRKELLMVQFDFTNKGAIKIESKADMAKRGVKSPDALDAVVYSIIEAEVYLTGVNGMKRGDVVMLDPWEYAMMDEAGLPI